MTLLKKDKIWETIDSVISEVTETNEAIRSYGSDCVRIDYSRISNNKLYQRGIDLNMRTLQLMTISTLQIYAVEVIDYLRSEADVV